MKSKKNLKRKRTEEDNDEDEKVLPPPVRSSDEPVPRKMKWINKQRVLVLATRGVSSIHRHLMKDLKTLLPHSKSDVKIEKSSENLRQVNEIAEGKNCNKCILFENRKRVDLYMWLSNINNGPCAKFLVENIHTMRELKLTGNCLKGSRPLLTFDETFKTQPAYQLLKELFIQIFSTPNHHPKSQPFVDHIISFTVVDHKIWFRNYQILTQDGALVEIGPRFVLDPIKIYSNSFSGELLWENPHYVSVATYRSMLKTMKKDRYLDRKMQKENAEKTKGGLSYDINDLTDIFEGDPGKKAEEILRKESEKEEQTKKRFKKKRKSSH